MRANSSIKSLKSIFFTSSLSIANNASDDNLVSVIADRYLFFIIVNLENDRSASQFAIGIVKNSLNATYILGKTSSSFQSHIHFRMSSGKNATFLKLVFINEINCSSSQPKLLSKS